MTQKINVKGTGAVFNGEMPGKWPKHQGWSLASLPRDCFCPCPAQSGEHRSGSEREGTLSQAPDTPVFSRSLGEHSLFLKSCCPSHHHVLNISHRPHPSC